MNSHIDIFNVPEAAIRTFVDELWEFRPDFLLVNPTYLQIFCSRAVSLGLDLPRSNSSFPATSTCRTCNAACWAG